MIRLLLPALAATAFSGVSLFFWRLSYEHTDWAVLSLIPLGMTLFMGVWPLNLEPWTVRLTLVLRQNSPLTSFLTGRIRATALSAIFVVLAITLLAWQALDATVSEAGIMLAAFLVSGCIFSFGKSLVMRHLQQPFAQVYSTSLFTWLIAVPFTFIIAAYTWTWSSQPGSMLDASLPEALQIGLSNLPERGGWISTVLSLPYGYEAAKLWGVVQLRDYPVAGLFFSLDTALFSFVLCRTAIIVTQFFEAHIVKLRE